MRNLISCVLMFLPRLFLLLMLFFGVGHAQTHHLPVRLGDTTVEIEHVQHGHGKAFVHVHQSETTALQAARAVIHDEGGSLVTLHHPGGRNIVFHLQGVRYEFDPNRMFTDVGIQKTLKQFGPYSKRGSSLSSRVGISREQAIACQSNGYCRS